MKKMRWQLVIVVLALAAIVVLLWIKQPVSLQGGAAPILPVSGGVYSEALVGEFGRLNPILDYFNQPDRDASQLIFSGLVRFDDRGLPNGDLAESWGISQDGKVYNFSIRPNAVWHDGKPVTSEDLVFTSSLLRSEELPIPDDVRNFWSQVEVVALDERTIQFRLPEAYAPFLDYLAFGVLPKHLLDGLTPAELINTDFNLKPVGSGPFRFEKLLTEDGKINGVALASFPDFYGQKPYLDRVELRYYPDSQAALAAYQNGDVMGVASLDATTLAQALKLPSLKVYTGRLPELTLVYLNLDDKRLSFLQDSSMRRLLLKGLNRQSMIDHILNSQAFIADGPVFPGSWAYFEGIERIPYDPDAALAELKAAGYTIPASGGSVREKDGVALSFELVHPDTPLHTAIAEAIRRDWGKLGVDVQLKAVAYDQLVSEYLSKRDFQAALVDLNLTRSPDPDPYPFWDQAQITDGQNYSGWNDRQASEFLERARITADLAERTKAYRNFQVRFTTEMPALPLYYPVYSYGVDGQVQGVSMGPLYDISDRLNTISAWYLAAQRTTVTPAATTPAP